MSVPLTLLGLLEREPSHGYDLKRDYDSYFGRGKPLPYGQVYATLSRLARDGKAIAGPAEHGEGPDRKRYTITAAGIADVEAWLSEPAPPEPHLQTVLFAKVVALSVDDEATSAALAARHKLRFPVGHSADAGKVAAATGAYVNDDRRHLQSTGFVLAPDGTVLVAVYSSDAIGRLVADDVAGYIRYLTEHAA